jgi:hypothetical protein
MNLHPRFSPVSAPEPADSSHDATVAPRDWPLPQVREAEDLLEIVRRDRQVTADAQRRTIALGAAIVLRDCSLRPPTMLPERRACRVLMREAAITWRHGTTAAQWE